MGFRSAVHPGSRRIIVSRFGGPEVLELFEEPAPLPGPGEVRVRRTAAGVGFADVLMREGAYPGGPTPPFTPGFDLVGTVDAVGDQVTGFEPGQVVAALVGYGAYADHVCVPAAHLVPVPPALDPAQAVALVLDYVAAYQMLHRVARVYAGELLLVHGAAGGVGTAALELGGLAGLGMFGTVRGTAAVKVVAELGAKPIDDTTENFASCLRLDAPGGVDVVLDGIGGWTTPRSYRLLRDGGRLVRYGRYAALRDGHRSRPHAAACGLADALVRARAALRGGHQILEYDAATWRNQRLDWFREDLGTLFGMLADKRIDPIVTERAPLQDAARLHERLGLGQVTGKQILC